MSARSAQRTRWRRWRMGRDIAGGKDRDGRLSGLAGSSCRRRRRGKVSPCSSSSSFAEQTITRTTDEANLFIHVRWRSSWEAGCQQLTAEMGVND